MRAKSVGPSRGSGNVLAPDGFFSPGEWGARCRSQFRGGGEESGVLPIEGGGGLGVRAHGSALEVRPQQRRVARVDAHGEAHLADVLPLDLEPKRMRI